MFLEGPQTFQSLLKSSGIKKTALSNHLKYLISANLIQKPAYARYEITLTGKSLLQALVDTHKRDVQARDLRVSESREFSFNFIDSFFKK